MHKIEQRQKMRALTLLLVVEFFAMAALLYGAVSAEGPIKVALYVGVGVCIVVGGLTAKLRAQHSRP